MNPDFNPNDIKFYIDDQEIEVDSINGCKLTELVAVNDYSKLVPLPDFQLYLRPEITRKIKIKFAIHRFIDKIFS